MSATFSPIINIFTLIDFCNAISLGRSCRIYSHLQTLIEETDVGISGSEENNMTTLQGEYGRIFLTDVLQKECYPVSTIADIRDLRLIHGGGSIV